MRLTSGLALRLLSVSLSLLAACKNGPDINYCITGPEKEGLACAKGDPIPYQLLNNYYTAQVPTAQILVEGWKAVGLNVEIEMKENWQQILERTPSRAIRDWSNSAPFNDPVSSLVNQHGPNGQQQQVGEYANVELNTLSNELESSTDRARRKQVFRRMLEITEREDPAYTVLHQNATFTAKPTLEIQELTDAEIARSAQTGTAIAHCPSSNMKLASGFCRVPELLAAGVTVGLGTDGPSSSNDLDMFTAMRVAALIHKGNRLDPTAIPATTVLRMATMGSATALGIDDLVGSIEVGKKADLVRLDPSSPSLTPIYDPISAVVYAASRADVVDVWIDGQAVVRNRTCTMIDLNRVLSDLRDEGRTIDE
jgi:hypothetical protein